MPYAALLSLVDPSAPPGRCDETGTYLNVEEDAGTDRAAGHAFGPERYRRLQAVKAAWNPDDVFRHRAHIALDRQSRGLD